MAAGFKAYYPTESIEHAAIAWSDCAIQDTITIIIIIIIIIIFTPLYSHTMYTRRVLFNAHRNKDAHSCGRGRETERQTDRQTTTERERDRDRERKRNTETVRDRDRH